LVVDPSGRRLIARAFAVVGLITASVVPVALVPTGIAAAAGTISVTPNPVPVANNSFSNVEVVWSGQPASKLIFVSVCVKSTKDADFEVGVHCSPLAQVEINGSADGSGSAEFPVFRGVEPTTDLPWGCFAPGDAVPPGILGATTCFVRVTNDVVLNSVDAVETTVSVTGAGDPVDRGVLGAPVPAPPVPLTTQGAPGESGQVTLVDGLPIRLTG